MKTSKTPVLPIPSPRPSRRWPYAVPRELWSDAVAATFGGNGQSVTFEGYVKEKALLSIHRYAISLTIKCPVKGCGRVLDISRDVVYRDRVVCSHCFLDSVVAVTGKIGAERMREELLGAFVAGNFVDGRSFYGCTGRRLRDGKVKPPLAFSLRCLAADVLDTSED